MLKCINNPTNVMLYLIKNKLNIFMEMDARIWVFVSDIEAVEDSSCAYLIVGPYILWCGNQALKP